MLRNALLIMIATVASLIAAEGATRLLILTIIKVGWAWEDSPTHKPLGLARKLRDDAHNVTGGHPVNG